MRKILVAIIILFASTIAHGQIRASDIQEAIKIAKDNPEFEYVPSATIEVRPIKTKEVETGFVYPR